VTRGYFKYYLNTLCVCISRQPAPKKVPRTIENTRIFDETVVDAQDEEVNLFVIGGDVLN